MKNVIVKLSLIVITLAIITSCSSDDILVGSGKIIEQERTVSIFDKVLTQSSVMVSIVYGPTQRIIVSADDNIINDVETSITNTTLEIGLQEGNYNNITVNVAVTIPNITEFVNSGSGNINILNFDDLEILSVNNSGSGNIGANGTINDLNVNNKGSGSFNGFGLIAQDCIVNNSGSGNSELNCSVSLSGTNSGSGTIFYKGTATESISNTGSGNVINSN